MLFGDDILNIVLLGPPGAGKGTQAKMIVAKYSIPHISTGDIFRKHISEGLPLGKKAQSCMDMGLLVPDEVTIDMVLERLQEQDCKNGFLLDGFPRTLKQAFALDNYLDANDDRVSVVLLVDVPRENIVNRMAGRRVCKKCGGTYHIIHNPPMIKGVCDVCKSNLVQRIDDQEETVKERLMVYDNETNPIIKYYNNLEYLVEIDGTQDIEDVFIDIFDVLGKFK